MIWYVAYGSNLARERFACYLLGGRPAGSSRAYDGCADPALARRDEPVTITHRVGFAGESRVWGGGVAVLDPVSDGAVRTPARAWLITVDQLAGIVAQERHRAVEAIDVDAVVDEGRLSLDAGMYGTVVHCGDLDATPMLTCTPGAVAGGWRPPTAAYLRWFARGLRESHALSATETACYLAELPGAAGAWTPAAITELLDAA